MNFLQSLYRAREDTCNILRNDEPKAVVYSLCVLCPILEINLTSLDVLFALWIVGCVVCLYAIYYSAGALLSTYA